MSIQNRFFGVWVLLFLFSIENEIEARAGAREKQLSIGVVLRLKDHFNDTVAEVMMGIEAAKLLFEKVHPEVKVQLHTFSHGDRLESVVEASQQVLRKRITAVIGGELTEESFVLRDEFKGTKTVLITPTSSNPTVTEGQPYVFRMCPSDRKVVSALAKMVLSRLKPGAVGVVNNLSSAYTAYQSNQFVRTFEQERLRSRSIVPLQEEKVLGDTVNFEAAIQGFINKRVTHVFIPAHPSDFLSFVLQAERKQFFPIYIGGDGWGSNEHVYGNLVEGSTSSSKFVAYRASFWKEDQPTALTDPFQTEYAAKFKKKPTAWSALGFDSAWTLMTAMNQVKDPESGEQIKKEMENLHGLDLVTQRNFKFGADHSPSGGVPLYRVDQKGIHFQEVLK